MATSVVMGGNSSDHHLEKMSTIRSREMEMSSLIMNGSGDDHEKHTITQIMSTGKPAGRRKKSSKLQGELGLKKKIPQRGMGVEKLERMRAGLNPERVVKKLTNHHHENYNINPPPYSSLISQQPQFPPACAFGGAFMGRSLSNGGSGSVGHGGQYHQTPAALLQQFQGFKCSGINDGGFRGPHHHLINTSSGGTVGPLFSDETFLSHHDHPFAAVGVGSRNRAGNGNGNRTEASRELSSIPNNIKWYSEQCGFCQKKFRGNGETIMCNINGERKMPCGSEIMSPVMNGFGSFAHVGNKGNIFNGGNLSYFAHSQTTPPPPPQEVEVKAVHSAGKGKSSSTTAGGRDGGSCHVVMEYEFFPGKFGGSTTNTTTSTTCSGFIKQEQEVVISLKTEAAASSVQHHEQQATMVLGEASSPPPPPPAAAAAISSLICSDHQNSNSIDLSLKLSSYYS